ncbi:hypothetical protein [Salmon gill poxvirus]
MSNHLYLFPDYTLVDDNTNPLVDVNIVTFDKEAYSNKQIMLPDINFIPDIMPIEESVKFIPLETVFSRQYNDFISEEIESDELDYDSDSVQYETGEYDYENTVNSVGLHDDMWMESDHDSDYENDCEDSYILQSHFIH